jgi:hypothetical protein
MTNILATRVSTILHCQMKPPVTSSMLWNIQHWKRASKSNPTASQHFPTDYYFQQGNNQ